MEGCWQHLNAHPHSSRNSVETPSTMYRAPLEAGSPATANSPLVHRVSCQQWRLELLLAVPPTSLGEHGSAVGVLSLHPIPLVTWRFLVDRSSCLLQRCLDGVTSRPPRDPEPSRDLRSSWCRVRHLYCVNVHVGGFLLVPFEQRLMVCAALEPTWMLVDVAQGSPPGTSMEPSLATAHQQTVVNTLQTKTSIHAKTMCCSREMA